MRAVMAYMVSRNNGNSNEMRRGGNQNNYGEARGNQDAYSEMRGGGGNRSEYGEMRRGGGNRNEYGEMRRGGNRNAYDEMGEDYGGAESRYRGRDGRWKAGRRRSEMDTGVYDTYPTSRRMGDDEDEDDDVQSNVIPWPYAPGMPHMPPESRMIGFGNRPKEYETRSHYDGGRQEAEVGGTMWMQPIEDRQHEQMDKQSMEKWVKHMRDDKDMPIKPWTAEEVKPLAMRFGYPTSGEKFDEFYTAIHMMKSDFCAVAEDFDVNTPVFFAALADAWLKDPDAAMKGREKLEAYHKYIVMGKK